MAKIVLLTQAMIMFPVALWSVLTLDGERRWHRRRPVWLATIGLAALFPLVFNGSRAELLRDFAFQWLPILAVGVLIRVRYPHIRVGTGAATSTGGLPPSAQFWGPALVVGTAIIGLIMGQAVWAALK